MWDASRSADWGAGREELSTFAAAFQAGGKLVYGTSTMRKGPRFYLWNTDGKYW